MPNTGGDIAFFESPQKSQEQQKSRLGPETRYVMFRNLVVVVSLLAFSAPVHANLITNGSFEVPDAGLGGFIVITPGQEAALGFTGWTVASGDVDVNDHWGGLAPFEGEQNLDLQGFVPGSLFQDFATTAGDQYDLFFAYNNNPTLSADPATATVTVTDVATAMTILTFGISHPRDQPWLTSTNLFSALGATTRLTFTSTDTIISGGVFLDAVNVELSSTTDGGTTDGGTTDGGTTDGGTNGGEIPEPSSLLLLSTALLWRAVRRRAS